MLGLILGVVAATATQAPPVFRAEVYVVPMRISIWADRQRKKPVTDVAAAEFTILLDKKAYVPVSVQPDARGPGYYLVSFSPPDHLRDGKTHKVEIKVRKWRIKQEITFPNAGTR